MGTDSQTTPKMLEWDPAIRKPVETFVRDCLCLCGEQEDEDRIRRTADNLLDWFQSMGWIKESRR